VKRKLRFLLPKREGGAKRCPETLLPPNKAATESSGIATLDGMVEHLVEALKQKLEVPLATAVETVVGRATDSISPAPIPNRSRIPARNSAAISSESVAYVTSSTYTATVILPRASITKRKPSQWRLRHF